jgi:hypothetical protein
VVFSNTLFSREVCPVFGHGGELGQEPYFRHMSLVAQSHVLHVM